MNFRMSACVIAPPRRSAILPASTVRTRFGSRYCGVTFRRLDTSDTGSSGTENSSVLRRLFRPVRHNKAMSEFLLEAEGLTKRYGETTVVNDVSFEIARGECLGVIGPNGAGKTTTIRMCLGLTAADHGSIRALGLAMPRDALAIKAQLGVVSQFDTLDPDFSCAENLLVYGRYFGMRDAQIRERIPRLLEFAALAHKADAKPGELSGGMRRRLSLARALVNDPKLP